MSVSTCAQSSAIAPPARKARADMSAGGKPMVGNSAVAAVRRCCVSIEEVMEVGGALGIGTVHKGVVGGALAVRNWRARRVSARTGQRIVWPLRA